ncbi:MAG: hypothetical protein MAG715_01358 [Methanonatronarchaeales archaeon]|nr:hypothetical protein [Methanonatronarchaeales archaeon]
MAGCQHAGACAELETVFEKLEFCLGDLDRGSFRGCTHGFVKSGDVVYTPTMRIEDIGPHAEAII